MQAGTNGNFTHSSGIPSRFASLHDVPCLLPPSAGFAWVSTCFHQLVTRRLVTSRLVLKNFNHSVEPEAAMQAGTKGNFTHSSGIPSRFASLHDVPCLLPLSAGFAWVSTCFHQLVTRRLVSSRLVLKNFNHSVEPEAAMQAGTKGNFTHSSGIPSRFASLHDVPCLLPPSAGLAWVSTCFHQLVTRRLVSSRLVLKNFNHSVGPAAAMQAGTKGNFTHSSGIPSRFASLHDVPCLLPPSAGFAWVSTCSHQLVTRRLVSSRYKPVKSHQHANLMAHT